MSSQNVPSRNDMRRSVARGNERGCRRRWARVVLHRRRTDRGIRRSDEYNGHIGPTFQNRRHRDALRILATLLLFAPVSAAVANSRVPVEVEHVEKLGMFFKLESVLYELDGEPFVSTDGLKDDPGTVRMASSLAPGVHAISMTLMYRGDSALFPYLNGYQFRVRARMVLEVRAGWTLRIRTESYSRDSLTLEWAERPAFALIVTPAQAVQDYEVLPLERVDDETPNPLRWSLPPLVEADLPIALPEQEPVAPTTCEVPTVTFGFTSFQLDDATRSRLQTFAECLLGARTPRVHIEGHCDVRGSDGYNRTLAAWRADSVLRFLVQQGVSSTAFSTAALGKQRPLCFENDERCHARNRRVELFAAPAVP